MLQPTNSSQGDFPDQYLGYPTAFEADRERQFRKFDRVIQLSGFDDILATPESRLEYVDDLTLDQFEQLLEFVNAVQTNLPKSFRGYPDQSQVITNEEQKIIDIMPSPEHKQELLGIVLGYAQQADSLEDKAFLLAMGLTTVHPFSEGNGRLARSIYYLLTEGYTPNDSQLQRILSEEGEDIITTDVNAMRPLIMGEIKLSLGTHTFDTSKGQLVPRLIVGVGVDNYNPLELLPSGLDQKRAMEVAGMFLQEDMKNMLPFLLVLSGDSDSANKAVRSPINNPDVFHFILDEFWANMTADDLSSLYKIAFDIKYEYVTKVMEQLSLGAESTPMFYVDEAGNYVQEAVATIMKRVVKGDLDLSLGTTMKRLSEKRPSATESPGGRPTLSRQERRKLEHQARRAARRSQNGNKLD